MTSDARRILGLAPGAALHGSARVPGSKSIAQRALVLAGLTGGTTRLTAVPDAADVAAAGELVAGAGARVERLAPAAWSITGRPPGPHRGWASAKALALGESGTLARLATAASAFCGHAGKPIELVPSGTLARRTSPALFRALRAAGVRLEPEASQGWPVRIHPIGPPSEVGLADPGSSQEVSALLTALAAYPDELALAVAGEIPSRPYLELTCAVLASFGVSVSQSRAAGGERFVVRGPLRAPEIPFAIEPDASAAAVALAAGCLSEGRVEVRGLGSASRQGDVRIVEHLRSFGCDASASAEQLSAQGFPAHAAELDLAGEPDLAPVLAAVAAAHAWRGGGASTLTGLGTLPGKESSRIAVLAAGFEAAGIACEAGTDFLRVGPRHAKAEAAVVLDPHGDHRMAFAFALLGLERPDVLVRDAQCVSKSWPRFWEELQRLGANVSGGSSA